MPEPRISRADDDELMNDALDDGLDGDDTLDDELDEETPELPVVFISNADFDAALVQWLFVDEVLVPRNSITRKLKNGEAIDRYAFTAFVEALRSAAFEEDPFETLADLELPNDYSDEDEAWQAICDFYAARACVLLQVGETAADECDEFIVGEELARHFGFLSSIGE
jgi:hypothetical protein